MHSISIKKLINKISKETITKDILIGHGLGLKFSKIIYIKI